MSGMTFVQLQALVKDRLFEGSGALPGGGLLTDLKRIINDAHTMLYNDAVQKNPGVFTISSADLPYVPATGIDAFSATGLGGTEGCHMISALEIKNRDGTYIPLSPMARNEVGAVGGANIGVSGDSPCSGWFLERFKLYLYPRPLDSQTVRVVYVPGVTDLVADGDYPFLGALRNFHVLVGYEAIMLAADKDETPALLYRSYKRLKTQFDQYLTSIQRQAPRRVQRTDDNDYDY